MLHHASIRTADIYRAIAFYERLGFVIEAQFTTGGTLACWMTGWGGRIELIQIPQPRPAPDAFGDEHYTGYYHLSFDLTALTPSLPDWLVQLRTQWDQWECESPGGPPLRVLLDPEQQQIGAQVYEVAFIADADGLPLELMRRVGDD